MTNKAKKIPPHLGNQGNNDPNFSPYPHDNPVAAVNPFDDGLAGLYPVPQVTQLTEHRRVETSLVIESCLNELRHANSKKSTIKTYRKGWARFEAQFDYLPTERDVILGYLEQYNGKSGRFASNREVGCNCRRGTFINVWNPHLEWNSCDLEPKSSHHQDDSQ